MSDDKTTSYDDVEPRPEALLFCAKLCHAAIKAYNDARGEITLDFGLIKAGLVHAIQDAVEDERIDGKEMHRRWMEDKLAKGWVHGPEKDAQKRTHPCILGYEELPAEQRVKDNIILGIAREFFA